MGKFPRFFNWLAITAVVLFALAGILVSVNRFRQYEIWYYDFGICDQAIWEVAHGQPPVIDHFIVPGKWTFADHFRPSIFLLSPLYLITDNPEIILIAQAMVAALSGWVIYKIAQWLLKNNFVSLAVMFSYFLFQGLQNAVITEFHELTVMTLPLALCFWAIFKNKKGLFWLCLLIVLGFKESLFLLGMGLAFFIFVYRRDWRKEAVLTFFVSVLWGIISIKIIIPFFAGGPYYYAPTSQSGLLGYVIALFTPALKVKTLFQTFWSFLFLPLLYWPLLPIFAMNFVSRFLSDGATRWDLGLHYSAEIAPTLAVSTVLMLSEIKKRFSKKVFLIISLLLVINSILLYRFVFHGPFALAYNPVFYRHSGDFAFLDNLVSQVPKTASVMAQNDLAARFTHQKVWVLRDKSLDFNPDYILMDLRPGQNPNNFLGLSDPKAMLEKIQTDGRYSLVYHQGDQYAFKKRQ